MGVILKLQWYVSHEFILHYKFQLGFGNVKCTLNWLIR